MNKADAIYLGKVFVEYIDAIKGTEEDINKTSGLMRAIIEGLDVEDKRQDEITVYQMKLTKIASYASSKGISLDELIKFGEDYKKISFANYLNLKSHITIKGEVEDLLV